MCVCVCVRGGGRKCGCNRISNQKTTHILLSYFCTISLRNQTQIVDYFKLNTESENILNCLLLDNYEL